MSKLVCCGYRLVSFMKYQNWSGVIIGLFHLWHIKTHPLCRPSLCCTNKRVPSTAYKNLSRCLQAGNHLQIASTLLIITLLACYFILMFIYFFESGSIVQKIPQGFWSTRYIIPISSYKKLMRAAGPKHFTIC